MEKFSSSSHSAAELIDGDEDTNGSGSNALSKGAKKKEAG